MNTSLPVVEVPTSEQLPPHLESQGDSLEVQGEFAPEKWFQSEIFQPLIAEGYKVTASYRLVMYNSVPRPEDLKPGLPILEIRRLPSIGDGPSTQHRYQVLQVKVEKKAI